MFERDSSLVAIPCVTERGAQAPRQAPAGTKNQPGVSMGREGLCRNIGYVRTTVRRRRVGFAGRHGSNLRGVGPRLLSQYVQVSAEQRIRVRRSGNGNLRVGCRAAVRKVMRGCCCTVISSVFLMTRAKGGRNARPSLRRSRRGSA